MIYKVMISEFFSFLIFKISLFLTIGDIAFVRSVVKV